MENTAEGYWTMMTWIIGRTGVNREDMSVCMEHAGIYPLTFRCLFEEDWIAYTMVSPLHLKKSLGLTRGKNDRIDALRIADFCYTHRHKFRPCRMPSDSLQQLKRLMAECDRYVDQKRMSDQTKTGMGQFEAESTRSRTLKMLGEVVSVIKETEEERLTSFKRMRH